VSLLVFVYVKTLAVVMSNNVSIQIVQYSISHNYYRDICHSRMGKTSCNQGLYFMKNHGEYVAVSSSEVISTDECFWYTAHFYVMRQVRLNRCVLHFRSYYLACFAAVGPRHSPTETPPVRLLQETQSNLTIGSGNTQLVVVFTNMRVVSNTGRSIT
jgi:hypothetical protein